MPTQPQSLSHCSHVDLPHHPFYPLTITIQSMHSALFAVIQLSPSWRGHHSNPTPLHHHLNQDVGRCQPIGPSRSLNSVKSSFLFNNHHSSGSREVFYTRSTSNMQLLSQMMYFLPEPKYQKYFFCVHYISSHFKFSHSFFTLFFYTDWTVRGKISWHPSKLKVPLLRHRYSKVAKQQLINRFAVNTVSKNTAGPSQIQSV